MNKVLCQLILFVICLSCTSNTATEKFQSKRNNIINVSDRIKEIEIEDVLISNFTSIGIIDKYLFITDYKSANELIHIFDKKGFKYVTSTGFRGQGPGEIANIGNIAEDKMNRKFYVSDHGKKRIFSYDLDSAILDPAYLPVEKMKMDGELFPDKYIYLSDTLSIGIVIQVLGDSDYQPSICRFNMLSGEMTPMSYKVNTKVKKKRISFALSPENGIYVECYRPHDLATICSIEGNLKYNIYGPNWDSDTDSKDYFGPVVFCGDRIVALYSGEKSFTNDRKSNLPTKFMVFDLEGNYMKTLESGYDIVSICYDKDNHRIIMNLDDVMQFAYLDLGNLLN